MVLKCIELMQTFGKVQSPIYPMSNIPHRNGDPLETPQVNINLAYVPCYNGRASRNNLEFIDK